MIKSREIHLKSRPTGPITQDNFEMVTVEVPSPTENEVLIKNLWMSIDAGQRTLMTKGESELSNLDLPARWFELGEPMEGQVIGQVIESRNADLPIGTLVVTNGGWREYLVFSGKADGFLLTVLDNPVDPLTSHLHVLSIYGASAYFHVTDCAKVQAGHTVWISTAAGTVGSIACQIAKISGCRVVGTTSSDEKVNWLLNELELDAAFNYRKDDLLEAMKGACPDGIDVYIDYAGGKQLEVAIDLMNPHGRIIKAGDTSMYDTGVPTGPKNIFQLVLKRVSILGCSVFDCLSPPSRLETCYKRLGKWVAEGKIKMHETVYEGIENAVQAQIDLFAGKNTGKMLVKVGDPEKFDRTCPATNL